MSETAVWTFNWFDWLGKASLIFLFDHFDQDGDDDFYNHHGSYNNNDDKDTLCLKKGVREAPTFGLSTDLIDYLIIHDDHDSDNDYSNSDIFHYSNGAKSHDDE